MAGHPGLPLAEKLASAAPNTFFGRAARYIHNRWGAMMKPVGGSPSGGNASGGGNEQPQQTNVGGSFLTRNPAIRAKPIKRKGLMGE